jgi:ubiquinone/menaquinone biosynthesis C-methylase UbiE
MTSKNINYAGAAYSKFRPSYSEEIYSLIYKFHSEHQGEHQLALDVGCGTGQATIEIANKFIQVYGIDTLQEQIDNATPRDNIIYQVGPGEDLTKFKDHSVDLITVGTAFHWFKHDEFFHEAKRVLKDNGTLAVFGYYFPVIKNESKANDLLKIVTIDLFDQYSNSNNRYIKNMYRDIKFPFQLQKWYITPKTEDITHISEPTQGSLMEASMTIERFAHYIKTASPYFNYLDDEKNKGKGDPVDNMIPDLMKALNVTDINHTIQIEWPTALILAKNDA